MVAQYGGFLHDFVMYSGGTAPRLSNTRIGFHVALYLYDRFPPPILTTIYKH